MKIHDYAKAGDIAGLAAELAQGIDIESRDDAKSYTPLMWAARSSEAGVDMIRFLTEQGANAEATIEKVYEVIEGKDTLSVLRIAVQAGNREKIEALLEAGASLDTVAQNGHDIFWDAIAGFDETVTPAQIEFLEFLIERGAKPTFVCREGDMGLQTASDVGRFDLVEFLLKHGADASYLEWTDLMFAVTLGNAQDVEAALQKGADLPAQDIEARSAWHLAIIVGDKTKCELLLAYGADKNQGGYLGCSPLNYAIDFRRMDMLRWLLEIGVDVDDYGELRVTPLLWAVIHESVEAVRILMEAGADRNHRDYAGQRVFHSVHNLEIFRLFLDAGEKFEDTSPRMQRLLLGFPERYHWDISKDIYQRDKLRRFGTSNPEVIDIKFWRAMVHSNASSDEVCSYYGDSNLEERPVWTYKRLGKTLTPLPDGRYIEIAGENEDSYDPHFCIYNDVFVHYGDAKFDILGYPPEVFPPTDFHTATLVGKWIYIVGCLGYHEQRVIRETPVYRLNTDTYAIEKIETTGTKPGWISHHRTALEDGHKLRVTAGKVILGTEKTLSDDEDRETAFLKFLGAVEDPGYAANTETFILDLETLVWSRVENAPQ
jgi:ankyrin repeat protein